MMARPLDVEEELKGFRDPVVRDILRAYLEAHNEIWFGIPPTGR